jgi:acetyl-CoA carboxylase biotin carboxylase subunit
MGDKISSRLAAMRAGVEVVPGTTDPITDPDSVRTFGEQAGWPVAIKAAFGGGGRGMKVVRGPDEVESAIESAQREARAYFGRPEIYVERYLTWPRHVEMQIIGDTFGNMVWVTERDCSAQRRHQKLIEESPSPAISPELREKMGRTSVEAMQKLRYNNVGTIEYLLDERGQFYFMEMNTRIQVEHPVTELVTGVDLVREQIRMAYGHPLRFKQSDIQMRGAAIECRVNAEDPVTFAPWPGRITGYSVPGGYGVRVDSAAYENYTVLPHYDSLLAKLIVHAEDRETAIRRMQRALGEYVVEGIRTNIPFHRAALAEDAFLEGQYDTRFVERLLASETGTHRLKKAIEETP